MDSVFTPCVDCYRDSNDVPAVPRELYYHTFLVLWRSRKTAKQLEFKIVTYNSRGWMYPNRELLGGLVHGWVKLEQVPLV